jgi:hypothetical protein
MLNCRSVGSKLQFFLREDNPHVHHPKLAGIFSTIVTLLLKSSSGAFALQLPDLSRFLIHNLTTISYRDLLAFIILTYPQMASFSPEFVDEILSFSGDETRLTNALLLIRALVRARPSYLRILDNESMVRTLLRIASSLPSFASLNSLLIVASLVTSPIAAEVHEVISSFERQFEQISDPRDIRSPALLSLFPSRLLLHVGAFMEYQIPTLYAESFVNVIRSLSRDDFCSFIESSDILTQLMSHFHQYKTHGHITNLARCLDSRSRESNAFNREDWRSFVAFSLVPHLGQLNPSSKRTGGLRGYASLGDDIVLEEPPKRTGSTPTVIHRSRTTEQLNGDGIEDARVTDPPITHLAAVATVRATTTVTPLVCMKRQRPRYSGSKTPSPKSVTLK